MFVSGDIRSHDVSGDVPQLNEIIAAEKTGENHENSSVKQHSLHAYLFHVMNL